MPVLMKSFATLALATAITALPAAARHRADTAPTMGWSSWNTYRVNISDSLICRQARAMVESGLHRAGYRYVNIDDGAFDGRTPDGTLHAHATRFPRGLKPVVDYIHSLGLKAGTYSDAGRNTCGNYWDQDKGGVGIGLYGHETSDVQYLFNELGFDFIKVDFCGGDPAQNTERLDLDEQQQYTAISRALHATVQRPVRLNVCRWAFPGTWVHSVGDSWRISPDIQNNWASVASIIERNLYLSAYASAGHYNDMDMLEVGRALTEEEDRTHFGMWCVMSSPLLIGCDLTTLRPATLQLLTNPELIAINQDPLGLQAHVVARSAGGYVLVKDLLTRQGRRRAVAFYNPAGHTVRMSASRQTLGYAATGRISVRDALGRTDLAALSRTDSLLSAQVPAHGLRLFVLSGRRAEPVRYEAENAWLSRYSAITPATVAHVAFAESASCGAYVTALGQADTDTPAGNALEWRDVSSRRGGTYVVSLHYRSPEARTVEFSVNGSASVRLNVPAAPDGASVSTTVRLRRGLNTLRLGNESGPAPDVDYMDVRPTKADR